MVDRPLRVALVSMKVIAMALLVAAAAFAPANRSVDLQQAVSRSLDLDRAADHSVAGSVTSSGEADSSKVEEAPADAAGIASGGAASPRPLPPTDTELPAVDSRH